MRIAFFGTNHSVLSVACLRGLIHRSGTEILVGVDKMLRRRITKTILRGIRLYGMRTFAWRTLILTFPLLLPGLRMNQAMGSSLLEITRKKGISWFECVDVNSASTLRTVTDFSPDLIVVANFSQILQQRILSVPPKGCINVHPSLLPKYRGPLPLYWAIRNREKTSGVSVHFMDEGIDTGDIIIQRSVTIGDRETEGTLRNRIAGISEHLLPGVVDEIWKGTAPRVAQANDLATYYSYPRRDHHVHMAGTEPQ